MINNNTNTQLQSCGFVFSKSLLLGILLFSMPFLIQAGQMGKQNTTKWLCTGMSMYFVSRLSTLHQKSDPSGIMKGGKDALALQLTPSSRGRVDEDSYEEGSRLVQLYLYNQQLNASFFESEAVDFINFSQMDTAFDWVNDMDEGLSKKLVVAGSCGSSKLGRKRTLKKLGVSLLLVSSISGVDGAKIKEAKIEDQGAALCAACIAGCCVALGMGEGPLCVIHCAISPACQFLCAGTPF